MCLVYTFSLFSRKIAYRNVFRTFSTVKLHKNENNLKKVLKKFACK